MLASGNVACFLELTRANDYEPFFSSPRSARFARQCFFAPARFGSLRSVLFGRIELYKVGKEGPTDRKLASQQSHSQLRIKSCINKARGGGVLVVPFRGLNLWIGTAYRVLKTKMTAARVDTLY